VRAEMGSGVALWSSELWRERAVSWLDEQLLEESIERTGAVTQPRIRPWATLLTAPTTAGRVWLKAVAPPTAFEVDLYLFLHRVTPERVLAPLAADPGRGWLLLPDGGPPLGERLAGAALLDALVAALPRYAQLQRTLAAHVDQLLALGVNDMRPAIMPERFEQAVAAAADYVEHRGSAADRRVLAEVAARRDMITDWCARLADRPGPASLDHNDLQPRNILTDADDDLGHVRFYDWGDAVVAHPFASMLVLRQVVPRADADDPRHHRLRDAYLEPFDDLAGHAELVDTVELACRVGQVARALTWDRALRAARPGEVDERWARAPFECLAALLDDGYPGPS
jgi:Phosphotransferase enzyme family